MSTIRQTPKFFVFHFCGYQTPEGGFGPADVYVSKSQWTKTATHYGWGAALPTEKVHHMGDVVKLGEVLFDALHPDRLVWTA